MMSTAFAIPQKKGMNVLLFGAHCDDIEIGCGGTLLKLIENYDILRLMWVVFTSGKERKKEAISSAKQFLKNLEPDQVQIKVFNFRDGYLPSQWSEVKDQFEKIKEAFTPDIIFTHYRDDLHQDHRLVNELTWNTFRNHLIFEYEIPKYDGDLGKPNIFVPIEEQHSAKKKKIIIDNFKSQRHKHWLDDSLLTSLLRLRGIECASESKYAEAFYARKMIV